MECKGEISDCSECLEILQLMLDKEASAEQETNFNLHIESCLHCFNNFQLEKQIKELIKKKVSNLPVPDGLANDIRSQIQFFPD